MTAQFESWKYSMKGLELGMLCSEVFACWRLIFIGGELARETKKTSCLRGCVVPKKNWAIE